MTLNNLVGIPWKLNGKDFRGTDCINILSMYFNYLKGRKFPYLKLRRHDDNEYLEKLLFSYGTQVSKYNIKPDDIMVFLIENEIHAGIYLGFDKFLHSVSSVGSCIEHLREEYRNKLQYGVRLNG